MASRQKGATLEGRPYATRQEMSEIGDWGGGGRWRWIVAVVVVWWWWWWVVVRPVEEIIKFGD